MRRKANEAVAVSLPPHLIRPADAFGKPVCRLGLALRGGADLASDDVLYAIDRGVNFLNWPGQADYHGSADAFTAALHTLGNRRDKVVLCVQFDARSASEAEVELPALLGALGTSYLDVVTLYYIEERAEWDRVTAPDGALTYLRDARRDGVVRRLGVTSHQRKLAAEMAQSGLLDTLMIRYNAAHRGAESDIFPAIDRQRISIIAYTALRWRALLQATPEDPPGHRAAAAPEWYRFVLHSPAVAVVLAAPANRAELEDNLRVLSETRELTPQDYQRLAEHGERVRRHAGRFP